MNNNNNRIELEARRAELNNIIRPFEDELRGINQSLRSMREADEFAILNDPANADFIALAEENDAEIIMANPSRNASEGLDAFEDDGSLHIQRGNISAAFICNQEIRRSEWNREARPIMRVFGIPFSSLR